MQESSSVLSLEALKPRVLSCTACSLAATRTNVVFGEGNPSADVMFIGEGPGETEDETGRPFVGLAGQKLDEVLNSVDIKREDVYIGNVVKCRPPGNRVPSRAEMDVCFPYLESQIALVKPALIVTLGNTSTQWLLPDIPGITQSHGKFFSWRGGILLFPMFHPSYLLRNPSREKGSPKYLTWLDIQKVSKWLNEYRLSTSV
ncbi:MAG: uracil-DNA glycosylase [Candidatus Atribacteria bacterium]|jgi:uracil-DNA glycosylase family 4|nr:MAG: uracil-DNA glycosylase [Candidatus Atribacteria bacterium]